MVGCFVCLEKEKSVIKIICTIFFVITYPNVYVIRALYFKTYINLPSACSNDQIGTAIDGLVKVGTTAKLLEEPVPPRALGQNRFTVTDRTSF